jgi:hypothetical protein
VGYFFTAIAYYSFFWAIVAAALSGGRLLPGGASLAWLIPVAAYGVRIFSSAILSSALQTKWGILRSLVSPLWDICGVFFWFSGLVGRKIVWAKRRYAISRDGKMKLLGKLGKNSLSVSKLDHTEE